jgi:TPR repeat protein
MPLSSKFEQLLDAALKGSERVLNDLLIFLQKPLSVEQVNVLRLKVERKIIDDPGNSAAIYLKALMLQNGLGYGIDLEKAKDNYELAISKGSIRAIPTLAVLYLKIDRFEEAAHWFDRGIAANDYLSIFNRAMMHEEGYGVPVNYVRAIELYNKVILIGPEAAMKRARMHEQGLGGPVDNDAAIAIYEVWVARNLPEAIFCRALMHINGKGKASNYREGIALLDLAVRFGHVEAIYRRAMIFEKGSPEDQNYQEALRLYRQAEGRGHLGATYRLAGMVHRGHGIKIDYAEARRLYKKASTHNSPDALHELGCMYFYGEGGVTDFEQAKMHLEKAISLGNDKSKLARAEMFEVGAGCPIDYLIAAKFYRQAQGTFPELSKKYLKELKEKLMSDKKIDNNTIDELSYCISVGLGDNLWEKDPEKYLIFLVKDDILRSEQKVSILAAILRAFPGLTATYRSTSSEKVPSYFDEAEKLAHDCVIPPSGLAQSVLEPIVISPETLKEEVVKSERPCVKQIKPILLTVASRINLAIQKVNNQLIAKRWHNNLLTFWPNFQAIDKYTIKNKFETAIEAEELNNKESLSSEENKCLADKYLKMIKSELENNAKDPYTQAIVNVLEEILQEIDFSQDSERRRDITLGS